jgi:hypothetical protein
VANSLVVASILRVAPAGTAMAVGAGTAAVGAAPGPDTAVVFALEGGVATVDAGGAATRDGAAGERRPTTGADGPEVGGVARSRR